jgi:DNA uptake protein ComE-like DNA-binding protein
MTRLLFIAVIFWSAIVDLEARGAWVTLQGCHFLAKRANDGDSFHVSVAGKEYIFRLYFVDAPETTTEFRDRVEEQAGYFGITVDQNTTVGNFAKAFTREKLNEPFAVRTCWQDAMGRSRLPRFYAFVQTRNGDLAEQLIENGLARVHGTQASPEGVTSARREWQKLTRLERKAKQEKVGGWGAPTGRLAARARDAESTKGVDPFDAFFHRDKDAVTNGGNEETVGTSAAPSSEIEENKLDVNAASQTELENVRGIGPALAQRIIEARPFKSADDLQKVKGIGNGKKYEQIRLFFK